MKKSFIIQFIHYKRFEDFLVFLLLVFILILEKDKVFFQMLTCRKIVAIVCFGLLVATIISSIDASESVNSKGF